MATLSRISVYPVKSLDPADLTSVVIGKGGSLTWDRRWALVDADGAPINGKREPKLHRLRAVYDLGQSSVTMSQEGSEASTFSLLNDQPALARWFSSALEMEVAIVENEEGGFPDDPDASGPTIVSTATLDTVAGWFDMSIDETRRRFRANLEVDGVPPFWEDQLYTSTGKIRFTTGAATFLGHNPCQRCVVPTRDSMTGEVNREFTKRFNQRRAETLPAWAAKVRFNHFYRLSVNTSATTSERGKTIAVGNEVAIIGAE